MLFEFCILYQVNKVGNAESIAVILKRFDALSPAALENSSKAIIPSNTYRMQRCKLWSDIDQTSQPYIKVHKQ